MTPGNPSALIGCSMLKLPVPAPAWMLYSASPKFSQIFAYCRANYRRVLILSALHGAIAPDLVVAPYDRKIGDLSPPEIAAWRAGCLGALAASPGWDCFIPGDYLEALAPPDSLGLRRAVEGSIFAVSAAIGKTGRKVRGQEWPMRWLLSWAAHKAPVHGSRVIAEIRARGYAEPTVNAQAYRLASCPLFDHTGGMIRYRYQSLLGAADVPDHQTVRV